MKRLLLILLFVLLPVWAMGGTLTLDCTDAGSLTSFVNEVRSRSITGDTLIIADRDICAREMIRVVTDEEGNVIRPAILGCFQFAGNDVSIFIRGRVIKGKTALSGQQLTITNITDTGVSE